MTLREAAVSTFHDTLAKTLLIYISFFAMFACALGFGVVYNSTRIALSERGRELATLRVLGFSRTEISYILLGEVALLILLGLPLGCLAGHGLAWLMTSAFETELYRVPLVIELSTYGTAVTVALLATAASPQSVFVEDGQPQPWSQLSQWPSFLPLVQQSFLHVVDVAEPTAPFRVGETSLPGRAFMVAASNDRIHAAFLLEAEPMVRQDPEGWLGPSFPHLRFVRNVDGVSVIIDPEVEQRIQDEARATRNMFLYEGFFFIVLLVAGVVSLLYASPKARLVGVDTLIDAMTKLLPTGPPFYPPGSLTDMTERFIAGEMILVTPTSCAWPGTGSTIARTFQL